MVDDCELMIGNWVYEEDIPKKITAVDYIGDIELNYGIKCNINGVIPIPITTDLLEKLGFKVINEELTTFPTWELILFDTFKLEIRIISPTAIDRKFYLHIDDCDCDTIGGGYINYLHQLQNLVTILTKQSLPITKEML